jgi:streptomycin 6-kinase
MGATKRLMEHYGPEVGEWLERAGETVAAAATRWNFHLDGFHDAGWTSVVGVGHDDLGRIAILKALPESNRYHQERAALTHWGGDGVCRLLNANDENQILMIEAVGATPGGARRPDNHVEIVADALPGLHRIAAAPGHRVPMLTDYYLDTVLPRIERRVPNWGAPIGNYHVSRATSLCRELGSASGPCMMLHSDLYAENVLFDDARCAVFIDPHAKVGSPAFDWAFWCVYYASTSSFATRAHLCRERVPALFDEVLAWSTTLAVDGALYYLEEGNPAATMMMETMQSPILAVS